MRTIPAIRTDNGGDNIEATMLLSCMKLFPEPPLLIIHSLKQVKLPGGYNGDKDRHIRIGTEILISVYLRTCLEPDE
ncbi:hypothetical protein Tco_0455963 [Tanacetum coccineum]